MVIITSEDFTGDTRCNTGDSLEDSGCDAVGNGAVNEGLRTLNIKREKIGATLRPTPETRYTQATGYSRDLTFLS